MTTPSALTQWHAFVTVNGVLRQKAAIIAAIVSEPAMMPLVALLLLRFVWLNVFLRICAYT